MTNFRTNHTITRKETQWLECKHGYGKVLFFIEEVLSTYQDGSVVTKTNYGRNDYRNNTYIRKPYMNFKNEKSYKSAMSRMIKDGLTKI
jgi:hypothetical protein